MRIAMVSEHASPVAALGGRDAGGQNVHVAELSRALAARGHELTVYTRADDSRLPSVQPIGPGVRVVHVTAGPARQVPKDDLLPYMGRFAEHLAAEWASSPPDIVHAHFWMSGMAALEAAAAADVPVVQTFHALGTVKRRHQGARDTSPAQRIDVERDLARRVDHVVATCTDEVLELRRLGAHSGQVTVIPCGVDVDRFRPDGPAAPRQPRPRLLAVGRMVPRKGFDDVIRALALVPDVELVIAGGCRGSDAAEFDRLASIARDVGVADRLRLLGDVPQDRMPALYRSVDAVVCYPWYEPFGIVPLEAMASGVPVVAAAVGGMIDSVIDGITGHLVAPRRPNALAAALARVFDDEPARRRLGAAGRSRAQHLYSWGRIAELTEATYHAVQSRSGDRMAVSSS